MQNRWGAAAALGLAAVVSLMAGASSYGAAHKSKKKSVAKKPAAGGAAMIAQGKKFVAADGCAGCHKIAGKGGTTGPDLTHVGARVKADEIAAQIKNPKAKNPKSIMPASKRPDKEIAAMAAYLAAAK